MMIDKTFSETVRQRQSVRKFLPEPLTGAELNLVLEEAQLSPSNSNTQPWKMHIVSGAAKDKLAAALVAAADNPKPDFPYGDREYPAENTARMKELGKTYFAAIGLDRNDKAGRRESWLENLRFFGAPHAAFLFMPSVADNVRVAGDVGMYGQTFLLSLTAHGFGGVPQTYLGYYADVVRETLGIAPEWKLLFGISFGRPDYDAVINQWRSARAPLSESVFLHE
ncbi:nitroreductase [Uruburuella testudinis]|uniref:Nitroreductase n=1 Tax=Uruburuella testudinis TaxID=1282863 RepID=A0ABY4DS03_9NEIS|nr:nitroreductase [Uruburuella testudinis]UOO81811.1 nitroreductase [Uruburuella testudinis]